MLPRVAVAVDAQPRQRPEVLEALSDASDDLFADARILLFERLGYKAAVAAPVARACTPSRSSVERRAMAKRRALADRVDARERAA